MITADKIAERASIRVELRNMQLITSSRGLKHYFTKSWGSTKALMFDYFSSEV